MNTVLIALIIFVVLLLIRNIKIASENERFAVFSLGRYAGLKGPGLLQKIQGVGGQWVKLSVGDRGKLIAPGMCSIKNIQVPVQIDSKVEINKAIRIIGFDSDTIKAMLDPDQSRKIVCEKCGHEMII